MGFNYRGDRELRIPNYTTKLIQINPLKISIKADWVLKVLSHYLNHSINSDLSR